jgi:hypothetical protein
MASSIWNDPALAPIILNGVGNYGSPAPARFVTKLIEHPDRIRR